MVKKSLTQRIKNTAQVGALAGALALSPNIKANTHNFYDNNHNWNNQTVGVEYSNPIGISKLPDLKGNFGNHLSHYVAGAMALTVGTNAIGNLFKIKELGYSSSAGTKAISKCVPGPGAPC